MAAAALALLFGYVALGSFIAEQMFDTSALIAILFLLHHLADSAVKASFDPNSGFGRMLRRASGLGERAIERLSLLFRTVADLLLIMAGLPLLFLQWTVTWVDFRALANKAFFGFKVGDVTISLWSVLLVVLVLIAGVIVTNLVVRWLDRRILAETRIDKGVQDSVRKGASYAGYILAIGFALGAAGLDFSNLALVAGALGVGIGFGLQSIVNNFVSGLILLAERPVRVGDWVVLPAGEGIIKRINVRSTEIETFDNCTIVVPNSNLITEAVRNWTHDDTLGRLTVHVGAAYDCNAEEVRDLLFKLARAHVKVLTYPEPQVTLSRFGPYAIEFEIKAHVADVFEAVVVASDLRYEILKAFREKAITIPLAPVVSMPR
jgi:small-conductance mechanosensitive channel